MPRRLDGPLACVIGDMDLLRPLGLARIPCALAAQADALPVRSRFVQTTFPWVDPARDPDGFIGTLATFADAQPEPPVLFYEGDWDLLAISRGRDRLAGRTRFLLPDPKVVEDLLDKARFQRLARLLGIPVPAAAHVDPAEVAAGDVPVRLPLVIKPLTRDSASWDAFAGGAKAVQVDTPADLRAMWAVLSLADVEVLLQELVPGPETAIESYHVYIDAAGEVAGEFTGRKIRTHPMHFGHSSAVETTEQDDVAALGREVALSLGLRGVAKLDFKRAPGGELRLLEVNPRFNLWHHPGAVAGVNLPALAYADLTGRPRPPRRAARAGVRWCHPVLDRRARKAAGIGLARWLAFLARADARSGLALDDPMPLAARVLSAARAALGRR